METVLGIAPCGTYDDGDSLDHRVLRWKAARVAALRYRILKRREDGCNCERCRVIETSKYETEP